MYKNIKIINKKGGIEKMKKFLSLIAITSLLAIAPVVSADNTISVSHQQYLPVLQSFLPMPV